MDKNFLTIIDALGAVINEKNGEISLLRYRLDAAEKTLAAAEKKNKK